MSPAPTVYAGTRKGLFTLNDHGDGYVIDSVDFLGDPVSAVLPLSDGRVMAALDTGHFGCHLRLLQDGEWIETTTPEYPERPADATDKDAVSREDVEWTTKLLWCLEEGPSVDGAIGDLWCGTRPGGLFRSSDAGTTWTLVRSLWDRPERLEFFGGGLDEPALHSISLHPTDPNQAAIAISCGGVWTTDDGAESWSVADGLYAGFMPPEMARVPYVQDPHRISRCNAAPEVMWCQHHSGFFRSDDGGHTWTEIEDRPPSVFGFAVAAHPTNPDVAWTVPAVVDMCRVPVDGQVAVARTSDGGKTWESLTAGLPGPHAYDLVWRHGLDVDATGTLLAIGSTTGSLWIGRDGGDHFETVSANLPPIACVRFGR